ncbi:MAG: phosphatidylserine decarboxylase family protein [Syntrophomonadaceae bacterium]|nr:phosphatidylserine decarboxylase family protein [Syntrophomonadaceae bacterium]
MQHNEIIAREGWIFIIIALAIVAVLAVFHFYIPALIFAALTLFCIFFFRNPERIIPEGDEMVVSPADGKVMDVTTVNEGLFIKGNAKRVRIFLSLFNVHINRAPVSGKVGFIKQVAGKFLPAYKDEVSFKNQRNYIGLETDFGRVLVVQITGLVARRLVCWVESGNVLQRGERFGLIRFGSCTEIYLPVETEILVKIGDSVKGGESVIAKFISDIDSN